ncbi:hypothetical protein [Sinosporangium siamense]|uniref:hypothetical protein n=1 Tax=Sinosporangium siamense TaxID=1367973 RepID=UPI00194DB89C|nr:hypothetical protein [Sinosporangium siamense]
MLPLLYGLLRGLEDQSFTVKDKYLRVDKVAPLGRTVQFEAVVGRSGQTSEIIDPDHDEAVVFTRTGRHIETGRRRGMIVAPSHSRVGLLILEVYGRSGAKTLLSLALKRGLLKHSNHVLDVEAVVDESALEEYIKQANVRAVTLRRVGLPTDIAEAVSVGQVDAGKGQLELRITPGRIKQFQRNLISRLRGDDGARRRLLQVGGLEFSELSMSMDIGDRKTTLMVTADRIPSFIYDLGGTRLSDEKFFGEVKSGAVEIGAALGMIVGAGWDAGEWSVESLSELLLLPVEVTPDDDGELVAE